MVKHNRKKLLLTALISLTSVAACQLAQPLEAYAVAPKKKFTNKKVVHAAVDIPAETVIPKSAVLEKSVLDFYLPVDTIEKSTLVVGRMSKFAIRKGETISAHQLCIAAGKGPALDNLKPELERRTQYLTGLRDPRVKVPLVYLAADVKAGETIQGNHMMVVDLPARNVPHDSCSNTLVASGMKARYALRKNSILSLYDLSL